MKAIAGFIFIAAAVAASAAHAQRARIDRVEVLRPGIYEQTGAQTRIRDDNISVGQRTEMRTRNVKVTTVIPARDRTVFGAEFSIIGWPNGTRVPLKVVWRYPSPGIIDPRTSIAKMIDEYIDDSATIGTQHTWYWQLGGPETLLPGVWTIELWDGNRMLVSQDFTLVRP
jgi:hypothetical protein